MTASYNHAMDLVITSDDGWFEIDPRPDDVDELWEALEHMNHQETRRQLEIQGYGFQQDEYPYMGLVEFVGVVTPTVGIRIWCRSEHDITQTFEE